MRKLMALTLATFACGGKTNSKTPDAAPSPDGPPAAKRLIVYYTSDEHSHLYGYAPEIDDFPSPTTAGTGTILGGATRRLALLQSDRAAASTAGIDTLTVSAGDLTQGALPQVIMQNGAPDFVVEKALGYDVMCFGNHEFDQGPDGLYAAVESAITNGGAPQIVASNIHFDQGTTMLSTIYGDGTTSMPIKTYHVITTPSGIKVGFIGIMGANAAYKAPLKAPVRFSGLPTEESDTPTVLPKIYADIQPVIDTLRNTEHVDVVIALSHGGSLVGDAGADDDVQIAQHVKGLDLIVSGHTHNPVMTPITETDPDGHTVTIVGAGAFDQYLGRAELVLTTGSRPTVDSDTSKTKLIKIDDTTIPVAGAVQAILDSMMTTIETSWLPTEIAKVEALTTLPTATNQGDLYYRTEATTGFDVIGLANGANSVPRETDLINLSADAMLWAADAPGMETNADGTYGTDPNDISEACNPYCASTLIGVQASGVMRADIIKGKTGNLSFADLFRILPLGSDPTDNSVGYPLIRAWVYAAEAKGAAELGVGTGIESDSDFFVGFSGAVSEYDLQYAPYDFGGNPLDPANGRLTKLTMHGTHAASYDDPSQDVVLFNRAGGNNWPSAQGFSTLVPVVTNLYIASFASAAGVHLKDHTGVNVANLSDLYVRRADGSVVRDYEAIIGYIHSVGALPSSYDATNAAGMVPRREKCTASSTEACP
jgi:5'-nucleotidase